MNDNTTTTSLHAYFAYRDAPAAVAWLREAFGFTEVLAVPDERGGLMHAELRLGDAAICLFSADGVDYDRPAVRGETIGHGAYVHLATRTRIDAVFASAVAAGAEVLWKPDATPWGNYRFRVLDPEGYEWTFGSYRPGEPPQWSPDEPSS